MTAEVVVTNEKLRVAHVCAIIIRGTMYHDTVFQLLTLDNTATGKNNKGIQNLHIYYIITNNKIISIFLQYITN